MPAAVCALHMGVFRRARSPRRRVSACLFNLERLFKPYIYHYRSSVYRPVFRRRLTVRLSDRVPPGPFFGWAGALSRDHAFCRFSATPPLDLGAYLAKKAGPGNPDNLLILYLDKKYFSLLFRITIFSGTIRDRLFRENKKYREINDLQK
ncbi:hypothetical protein [Pseudomonas aeruginosa]|uniref:hypothetical protein n=1 Tax=Pseudomonas aeruginosa TaxID=287 RepID=UPI0015741FE4|nr:hypothetical protein [Pseudomonas aeruginosa]NTU04940.1 hypothetical protein [Pseudomonas aeruginosa]NTU07332.1 hypothetical protein [Pseudomonas aeruginosa]